MISSSYAFNPFESRRELRLALESRVFDPGGAALADLEIPTRAASLRVDGQRLTW